MDLGSDPMSAAWGLAMLLGMAVVIVVLMFRRPRVALRLALRAVWRPRPRR